MEFYGLYQLTVPYFFPLTDQLLQGRNLVFIGFTEHKWLLQSENLLLWGGEFRWWVTAARTNSNPALLQNLPPCSPHFEKTLIHPLYFHAINGHKMGLLLKAFCQNRKVCTKLYLLLWFAQSRLSTSVIFPPDLSFAQFSQLHYLTFRKCYPQLGGSLVLLRTTFLSLSQTSTNHETAIGKICPPG